MYRAAPITQRDGSPLANSNCRMAAVATGIDFESAGLTTSTGAAMRARCSDQSGGTDSGDAAEAWASYGQELRVRDGATFGDALADLGAGRLVHLDVWQAAAAGPCLSGTGNFGHTIAVAPERSGTRWLTADPWCSPAQWVWWDEALLRSGAETWGGQVYTAATAGRRDLPESVLAALMRLAARRLMSAYHPLAPAITAPPDTGGSGGRILFTTTSAWADPDAPSPESEETVFNVAPITTHRSAVPHNCAPLYADAGLTDQVDTGSEAQPLGFLGSTSDAHRVVKGDLVLFVRRDDVREIVTLDTTYT